MLLTAVFPKPGELPLEYTGEAPDNHTADVRRRAAKHDAGRAVVRALCRSATLPCRELSTSFVILRFVVEGRNTQESGWPLKKSGTRGYS